MIKLPVAWTKPNTMELGWRELVYLENVLFLQLFLNHIFLLLCQANDFHFWKLSNTFWKQTEANKNDVKNSIEIPQKIKDFCINV